MQRDVQEVPLENEAAQGSAKLRAWLTGAVLGVFGGAVASGVGLVAGMCCLFQFANVLVPAAMGAAGGAIAAGVAPWSDLKGVGSPGFGAGLGFRAGLMAAFLSGLAGFLSSQLFQVAILVNAFDSNDVAGALLAWGMTFAVSVGFMVLAVVIGAVLGAASGALSGLIFGD